MKIKIGNLYQLSTGYERDVLIVTGIKTIKGQQLVQFFYIDNPEEPCNWNMAAFKDSMVQISNEKV